LQNEALTFVLHNYPNFYVILADNFDNEKSTFAILDFSSSSLIEQKHTRLQKCVVICKQTSSIAEEDLTARILESYLRFLAIAKLNVVYLHSKLQAGLQNKFFFLFPKSSLQMLLDCHMQRVETILFVFARRPLQEAAAAAEVAIFGD
jgi:hypothetical protein